MDALYVQMLLLLPAASFQNVSLGPGSRRFCPSMARLKQRPFLSVCSLLLPFPSICHCANASFRVTNDKNPFLWSRITIANEQTHPVSLIQQHFRSRYSSLHERDNPHTHAHTHAHPCTHTHTHSGRMQKHEDALIPSSFCSVINCHAER